MDWSFGFSAQYIVTIVDPSTFADTAQRVSITDGKIDKDTDSDNLESATLTVTEKISDGEEWIRIYLIATQDGDSVRVPLFTGLTSMPERKLDGTRETWSVDCQSVLQPCADVVLQRGYYVPIGSGAEKIRELLSVTSAPIIIDSESPTTTENIVAEDGSTNLAIALKVLEAINWRLRIDGDGTIHICEKASTSSETFGMNNDVLETSITETNDWYSCPNCLLAINETQGAAVARDDTGTDYSVDVRGREIWTCETDVDLSSDESISQYAIRRLKELQNPSYSLKYKRRFFPDVTASDIITLAYPAVNLTGDYKVTSQSLTLGYGCTVDEEVERYE